VPPLSGFVAHHLPDDEEHEYAHHACPDFTSQELKEDVSVGDPRVAGFNLLCYTCHRMERVQNVLVKSLELNSSVGSELPFRD